MEETQQRMCLDIMERLMKRPCAALFIDPVDEHEDGMSSYYMKIRTPMDLGQIQAKLLTNEYLDIDEWKDDIKLIWTNAERFHGKDSFVASLANEFKAQFFKMLDEEPNENTLKNWINSLKLQNRKLEQILTNAPIDVANNRPTVIELPAIPKMDTKAIQRLVDTSAQLTSKDDAREMVKIVLKHESGVQLLSKDVQMDVDALKPITMYSLERYIRDRFAERGKVFPEL